MNERMKPLEPPTFIVRELSEDTLLVERTFETAVFYKSHPQYAAVRAVLDDAVVAGRAKQRSMWSPALGSDPVYQAEIQGGVDESFDAAVKPYFHSAPLEE